MFHEPTEFFLIVCVTELIWTPRFKFGSLTPNTRSQTHWQREISHVMNGTIFCVCSTSAISVPSTVLKRCRKERKKMQVKKESQQNRSRWWIWYHDTVWWIRTCSPRMHQKARGKPDMEVKYLSSWTEQQPRTGRPVMGASSSSYSEWIVDEKWSSHEWKSGEMSNTSTERPVSNKLVIDIDMGSDTAAESDFCLKSRSFLNRVSDRLRKMVTLSAEDSMQDIDKRSMIWRMFMSSTLEASVFMGKTYSDNLHSKKSGKIILQSRCSRQLKSWCWNNPMRFLESLKSAGKFSMETVISG